MKIFSGFVEIFCLISICLQKKNENKNVIATNLLSERYGIIAGFKP